MPCFSLMNTYNTKTPTIESYIKYNEYNHTGVTDKQIEEKYSMNDTEFDKLIFTNYEKYKLIMEKQPLTNIFTLKQVNVSLL